MRQAAEAKVAELEKALNQDSDAASMRQDFEAMVKEKEEALVKLAGYEEALTLLEGNDVGERVAHFANIAFR